MSWSRDLCIGCLLAALFLPALIAISSSVIISDYHDSPHGGLHNCCLASLEFVFDHVHGTYKTYKYSTFMNDLGFGAGVDLVVLAEKPS